jgi:uncharacterized protein (TIGR03435 family)
MRRFLTGASLIALSFSGASAQSPAKPEFEVASIKPAQQSNDGRIMVRMGGDPGRIDYVNITLRDLIRRAYDVKDYQISGPDWMNQQRYDVKATHPPNTPREEVSLMLQKLLEDRFKMVIHKEKRQLPAYALTEAKSGFKLKPMSEEEVAAVRPPTPPGGGAGVAFGSGGRGGPGGPGGGAIPGGGGGRVMMSIGPGSRRIEAEAITISGLADMLANQTGRPVVDTTGIKGSYKIKLEFTPDESTPGPRGMMMLGGGPPPGAVAGGGGEHRPVAPEGAVEAPPLMAVLQEQFGLKLESRKEPLDVIVIEKAERVPTEN